MNEKPALKVGVRFWRTRFGNQLRIGTRHRNIELPDEYQEVSTGALLRLLDGSRTISMIAKSAGLSDNATSDFIAQLRSAQFIDLFATKSKRSWPTSTSASSTTTIAQSIGSKAIRDIQLEIERNAITISSKIADGGFEAVSNRSEFEILIFGNSRIAITLLGALRAAGFTRTNLIDRAPRSHASKVIQPSDLMGGIFRNSEILQNKSAVLASYGIASSESQHSLEEEQSNEMGDLGALEATPSTQDFDFLQPKVRKPKLIISVGAPSFDAQQRWISEGTAHLLISFETSGEVRLGPLVIPGETPCLTCVELSEIDSGLEPRLRPHLPEVEVSVGLALFTAGAALLETTRLSSTGSSALLAKSMEITSENFRAPEFRSWQFHPLCGCRA